MKLTTLAALVCLAILAIPVSAQQEEIPKNIADSVGGMLRYTEGQFLAIAEAMPEAKYSFVPSGGLAALALTAAGLPSGGATLAW